MIHRITEHEFYMEYEDRILNQSEMAIIIILDDSYQSASLDNDLESNVNDTDIMILVLNSDDLGDAFYDDFCNGIDVNKSLPLMLIYVNNNEIDRQTNIDIDNVYDAIMDLEGDD